MEQITQTLIFICLLACALFAVVVIIVLCEIIVFIITDRIKDVYRYASGKFKDHGEKDKTKD